MKNLSIAKKLMVAFGGCLLVLSAVGGYALYTQQQLEALSTQFGEVKIPILNALTVINTATSDYRAYEASQILATTPEEIAKQDQNIKATVALIESQEAYLEAHMKAPKAIAAYATFKEHWAQYVAFSQPTLALSRLNKNEEATARFRGPEQPVYDLPNNDATVATKVENEVISAEVEDGNAMASRARILMITLILTAFAAVAVLLAMLIKAISKPVQQMTTAMDQLAAGDMNACVPTDQRKDEIGKLAISMDAFRGQLRAAEQAKQAQTTLICNSIGEGLEDLASGNLTSRVDAELTGPFAKLKDDFNDAANKLQVAMQSVAQGASGINTGAGEIRQASDDLSQRTEQQAASLEETAAAMDELTTAVRQTAQGADRANVLVGEARSDAEKGGEVVRRAVEAMGGIERSSSEISEIISVIDGIAFQTNLLALNAGVEAARAGDAGRGFAVVASEVRALAQRSADAAKDVKAKITASSDQVDTGVELVGETGRSLERIIARIGEVSHLVSDIASSAQQQASGLQQVNTAVSEMDSVTQQNAAMVEQATAAARSLASEADGLARNVARFQLGEEVAAARSASAASPVHALQQRAEKGSRRIPRPVARGNTAVAAVATADDDWSQF